MTLTHSELLVDHHKTEQRNNSYTSVYAPPTFYVFMLFCFHVFTVQFKHSGRLFLHEHSDDEVTHE